MRQGNYYIVNLPTMKLLFFFFFLMATIFLLNYEINILKYFSLALQNMENIIFKKTRGPKKKEKKLNVWI